MKPLLILQLRPEDETADSEFDAILKFGDLELRRTQRQRIENSGIPDISLDDYSAIIVGGSPFDVSTPDHEKSLIQWKIENQFDHLFEDIVKRDFPFLGACSGNGLLGSYCGASISGKYSEPVGGVDVSLTKEGESDPILKGLPNNFRALVGHKEACDAVPSNSVLLATSASCPIQMIRVKSNVYATQFHPEADAEGFIVRINVYKHHGYFPPEDAQVLIRRVQNEDTPVPKEILRRFVQQYRSG